MAEEQVELDLAVALAVEQELFMNRAVGAHRPGVSLAGHELPFGA